MSIESCSRFLARLLLTYPKIKHTGQSGIPQVITTLSSSPPTAAYYHAGAVPASSINQQFRVRHLICLNCRTAQPLHTPVWHPSFGISSCCPHCTINPAQFHLDNCVGAIWWPHELLKFPPDVQEKTIEILLDTIARTGVQY